MVASPDQVCKSVAQFRSQVGRGLNGFDDLPHRPGESANGILLFWGPLDEGDQLDNLESSWKEVLYNNVHHAVWPIRWLVQDRVSKLSRDSGLAAGDKRSDCGH